MRRSAGLLATVALSIVTASGLFAGATMVRPARDLNSVASGEAVVRAFYDAVNAAIATGDLTALRTVVTSDFVDLDPLPGVAVGRAGLEEYVSVIATTAPNIRIEPEVVIASHNRAMARVAVQGTQPQTMLNGRLTMPLTLWGAVDVFRIAHGKIIERQPITDELVVAPPTQDVPLEIQPPSRRVLTIDRITLEPGARHRVGAISGERIVSVEIGRLEIAANHNVQGQRSADNTRALLPGASLVVPEGAGYEVRNDEREVAVMLSIAVAPPRSGAEMQAKSSETTSPEYRARRLVGGLATTLSPGPVEVTLGHLVLAPGAQLEVTDTTGPLLFHVESGKVELVTNRPGWMRRGDDGMSRSATTGNLGPSDGAVIDRDATVILRNRSQDVSVILVLALAQV